MNKRKIQEYIYENPEIGEACLDILCGEYIGSGASRTVYQSNLFENWVIKIERDGINSNLLEYETWCVVKNTKFKKWFAPCAWISDNGKVLIMEKTEPLEKLSKKMIKTLPKFISDVKRDNFGLLNGKLVTHDYAFTIDKFIELENKK